MTQTLYTRPLTADEFAPFGDIIDASGTPDKMINRGLCGRFHDCARLDFGDQGRAGVSIFIRSRSSWWNATRRAARHLSQ